MNYGKRRQVAEVSFSMRITQKQRDYIEAVAIEDRITLSEVVKIMLDSEMARRDMGVSTKAPRRRY